MFSLNTEPAHLVVQSGTFQSEPFGGSPLSGYAPGPFSQRVNDHAAFCESEGRLRSSGDVARIATQAKPKLLVLYHQLFMGTAEADLVKEVQRGYPGTSSPLKTSTCIE